MRLDAAHTYIPLLVLTTPVLCKQLSFKLNNNNDEGKVLNNEFSSYVEHLMGMWKIKGAAVTIITPDFGTEYGAWGDRSIDGKEMTTDVSSYYIITLQVMPSQHATVDFV